MVASWSRGEYLGVRGCHPGAVPGGLHEHRYDPNFEDKISVRLVVCNTPHIRQKIQGNFLYFNHIYCNYIRRTTVDRIAAVYRPIFKQTIDDSNGVRFDLRELRWTRD